MDPKSHESKLNTIYHQSRGAQRDARWNAKYADRKQVPLFGAKIPPPYTGPPVYGRRAITTGTSNIDKVRAEQQAAIAAARKAHVEGLRPRESDEDHKRKLRRIQSQVFVHAR